MEKISADELILNPESRVRIRFQDCDPLGHLNNARYFDYFLNTREEHTHQYYALNLHELTKQHQANWVVTQHQISYLKPALLGEHVIIQTKIVHADAASIVVEATMLNSPRTHLKAALWTEMRFVSLHTGRTTKHPEELQELLLQLTVPEVTYQPQLFQERVKQLNQLHKSSAAKAV